MHLDRSFLGWGIFFILLGAIPLAVQAGLLTSAQVADWWRFWPLILVGIGLGLLLRRTSLEGLGGLVVAATFGIMLGAALSTSVGIAAFSGGVCRPDAGAEAFQTRTGTFGSPAAVVEVDLDCGDLTIATDDGADWKVEGTSGDGHGPAVEAAASEISVSSDHDGRGPFDWAGLRESWIITLPDAPRLAIDAGVNAGDARLDLAGATIDTLELELNAASSTADLGASRVVSEIDIQVNAGSLGLTLPATGTAGDIEANAASVRLCVPAGVAVRLRTDDSTISSFAYDGHGLVHEGDTWRSPDFDTAAARVDLVTKGNAASYTLDPAEGCGG